MSAEGEREMMGSEIVIGFALILPGALLAGWAFMLMWGWFIVPFGLEPISLGHGVGLLVFWRLLTHRNGASKKHILVEWLEGCAAVVMLLGLGFLVHVIAF